MFFAITEFEKSIAIEYDLITWAIDYKKRCVKNSIFFSVNELARATSISNHIARKIFLLMCVLGFEKLIVFNLL